MSSESIPEQKVILASNSSIRKKILEDTGISFAVIPSEVSEEEIPTLDDIEDEEIFDELLEELETDNKSIH